MRPGLFPAAPSGSIKGISIPVEPAFLNFGYGSVNADNFGFEVAHRCRTKSTN